MFSLKFYQEEVKTKKPKTDAVDAMSAPLAPVVNIQLNRNINYSAKLIKFTPTPPGQVIAEPKPIRAIFFSKKKVDSTAQWPPSAMKAKCAMPYPLMFSFVSFIMLFRVKT